MDTTDDVIEPVDTAAPEYVVPAAVGTPTRRREPGSAVAGWLLKHQVQPAGPAALEARTEQHRWWKVMCLTGVDYFSSLAYVPAIAAAAAGRCRRWRP